MVITAELTVGEGQQRGQRLLLEICQETPVKFRRSVPSLSSVVFTGNEIFNDRSYRQEVAEAVREDILAVCCDVYRPLPGRSQLLSLPQRLEIGIDCDEVLPLVVLAHGKTVKNVQYLREIGVTHIINTASRDVWLPVEKLTNLGVKMFQFHVDDVPSANISPYFKPAAEFLSSAAACGGLTVINCLVGLSRSATVLTAGVMINKNWSLVKTLKVIRQTRNVKPNLGFMVQLLKLEHQMRSNGIILS